MSRPSISTLKLNEHLTLSERHPDSECQRCTSWWLYDTRAGMNIGMRAKTRDGAFVEAIEHWAKHAQEYEKAYADLRGQVNAFVGQVSEAGEDTDNEPDL